MSGERSGHVARAERSRIDRRDPNECRCVCGSLVARRVPDGVELKCRRCKRTVVLSLLDLVTPPEDPCGQRPVSPEPRRLDPSPEPVP